MAFIQTFWFIALRRLGPEDLPDSRLLFGFITAVYVGIHAPMIWMQYGDLFVVVRAIIAQFAMLVVCVWGMLILAGQRARFQRTMIALLGTSALLTAIMMPFIVWHRAILAAQSGLRLPVLAILTIVIWSLAVDGHIFSRALSRPFAVGLIIAVCYFIISLSLMGEILPDQ